MTTENLRQLDKKRTRESVVQAVVRRELEGSVQSQVLRVQIVCKVSQLAASVLKFVPNLRPQRRRQCLPSAAALLVVGQRCCLTLWLSLE